MNNYSKYFRKIFLVSSFLFIILYLTSCDNGTDPPPTKSPRNYTWTVDTLGLPNTFQTLMSSIWGSSSNNIYTCGHNSGNIFGKGELWYYNGETWIASDYAQNLEYPGYLREVHGSSEDNIWCVGYKSTQDIHSNKIEIPYIIQFNGNSWIRHDVDSRSRAYSVHAISKNDVWVSGYDGIVYHYNNNIWELDTIKIQRSENDFFIVNSFAKYKDEIYATGYKRTSGTAYTQYYFFKKENNSWIELDAFSDETYNYKFGSRLKVISPNQLLSYGSGGIYIWKNSTWAIYYSTPFSVSGIFAQGENNIIAVGDFDTRYHYNGNNWQELTKIDNLDIVYTSVWANKDEAFIIGHTQVGNAQKTIVLHGK